MPSLMRAAGRAALTVILISGAAEAAVYRSELRPAGGSQAKGALTLQLTGTVLATSGRLEGVPRGPLYGLLVSPKCGEFEHESSFLLAGLVEPGEDGTLSVGGSLTFDFRLTPVIERLGDMRVSLIRQAHVITLKAAFPRPVAHIACGAVVLQGP